MERISVLVRVRPLEKQEAAKGIPWKIAGNTISLGNQGPKFEFDRVFGEESKTAEIYEARTKDIVAATVRGFNGTVFAYGQTSSGKTYTMRGSPVECGVIPLAVQDVFKNIEEAEDREFLLRMSYMEIYNEEINDLLAPEHRKLQVHESAERGIFVAGLREEIVATPDQVLQLMEFGESHRHVGETNMNVYSSRSHTIFRMVIESRDKNEDDPVGMSCDAVRVSALNLVDLAGSERVAKTGAEGARLKEGSHINKSLMTLGTVINKLSEGVENQGGHVPYRDSKLTRILQPALGGNAKTVIICNITPALIHVDETKGTLQFASRALRVTNCAQVNEIMTDAALLKRQKKEIEELRAKLQGSHSEHLAEEILNLRNTLLQSELERERIALELQEEKKAQAERERRLQEQAQRIENLSTMVLYSSMDDREKRVKKNNRRETWCPHGPLKEFTEEELNRSSKGPSSEVLLGKRDRELPPPFQKLLEEQESNENTLSMDSRVATGPAILSENDNESNLWSPCALPDAGASVHVTERKKKFPVENMTLSELRDELLELQVRFQDLECDHENQRKKKDSEIEDLKRQLAQTEAAVSKQQRKGNKQHAGQGNERKGKSLTGWESEAFRINKQLQDQVKTLELEKVYMQRDLDRLMELAQGEKEDAKMAFEELWQELRGAQEVATSYKQEFDSALTEIELIQKEKSGLDKILSDFDDARLEINVLKTVTEKIKSLAGDSIQAFSIAVNLFQEILEAKGEIGLGRNYIDVAKVLQYCTQNIKEDENSDGLVKLLASQAGLKPENYKELAVDTSRENKGMMLDCICDTVKEDCDGTSNAKFDLSISSCASSQHPNRDSIYTIQESTGEGEVKLDGANVKLSRDVPLSESCALQELTILGRLDGGSEIEMMGEKEICSKLVTSRIDGQKDFDVIALLENEKMQALKLLKDLRNLSLQEIDLFSDKLACNSDIDELVSDLHRTLSEINELVNHLWGQGCSESNYCPDIQVTEVHLACSRGRPDVCPEHQNHQGLSPLQLVHCTLPNFKLETPLNEEEMKPEFSTVAIDKNYKTDTCMIDEEALPLGSDVLDASEALQIMSVAELESLDSSWGIGMDHKCEAGNDMMAQGNLNDSLGKTVASSLDLRSDSCHRQVETSGTFTVQVDEDVDSERNITAGLEGNDGLKMEEESLNSEITHLRANVERLETQLFTTLQERDRISEMDAGILKQLDLLKEAIRLSDEEKVQLHEMHMQTLVKLQSSEKEIESQNYMLKEVAQSLEHSNLKKIEAEKRISELEVSLHRKVEEQNVLSSEHKITCDVLRKTVGELESEKKLHALLSQKIEELEMLVTDREKGCADLKKKIEDLEEEKGLQAILSQKIEELEMLATERENYCTDLRKKVEELETEKSAISDRIAAEHTELEELKRALESAAAALEEKDRVQNVETSQLICEVSSLRKDVARSTSSALVREKESLRKELDKTKSKLKDTEAKLKNILQDKSKLEAEKANMDRELKVLRGQSTLLQRDISKRDSLADKRRESKACDLSKAKNQLGFTEQSLQLKMMELERTNFDLEILQENYNNVERLVSELEEKLAAMESELFVANEEREQARERVDVITYEFEVASEQLKATCSELNALQEKHATLMREFHECEAACRQMEDSIRVMMLEKEEMAMQLTDAFLQLEEEKVVRHAREKESMEAVKEQESIKLNMVRAEICAMKEDLQKVEVELESSKKQFKQLCEQLSVAELETQEERRVSIIKSLEIDQLREDVCRSEVEHEICQAATMGIIEDLKSRDEALCIENRKLSEEVFTVHNELDKVKGERDGICGACRQLTMQVEEEKLNLTRETTKLQVRLSNTRARLDAFRGRYYEALDEMRVMHHRFGEDSRKLKEELVASRLEKFELKKQLMGIM